MRCRPGGSSPAVLSSSIFRGGRALLPPSSSPLNPRRAANDLSVEPGFRDSRWLAIPAQLGDPISDLRLPRLRRVPGAGLASYRRGRATRGRNVSIAGQVEGPRPALSRDYRRSEPWLDAGARRELDDQVLARLRNEDGLYIALPRPAARSQPHSVSGRWKLGITCPSEEVRVCGQDAARIFRGLSSIPHRGLGQSMPGAQPRLDTRARASVGAPIGAPPSTNNDVRTRPKRPRRRMS